MDKKLLDMHHAGGWPCNRKKKFLNMHHVGACACSKRENFD